jgi:glycosyltransferase involved in cell wall biosynthesis
MIAVVIPVYNREHLVPRAIESVMAQTLPADEIIVVDDASTDRSVTVIEQFRKNLDNLTLISLKENGGGARARNVGIHAAKSDLVAFLDSDDVWYPDKLFKQAKEFETHDDAVAVFCGMAMRKDTGSCHHYIPKANFASIDLYHYNLFATMSCALIRRQTLLDIGGFDTSLKSCQDWDLFIRLNERGRMCVVQEELMEFWIHTGNRISRNAAGVLAGHEAMFQRIYERISNPLLKRKVRASHEMRLADIFSSDCFAPFRAIEHACKAMILAPSPGRWRTFRLVMKRVALGRTGNASVLP